MGDSFESVNLEDYVVNIKDCLIEYDIREEKKKRGDIIYKGFIKNSSQAVKIFKKPFSYNDLNQKIRFDNLMKAFNQGVVLADNIFIGQESNKQYYSYVIEPWFKNVQGNKLQNAQNKFQRLSDIIKSGELDTQRRQRLFQNLVISLKCLHQIGEPHYEISPKNIWIEDNYLVYLRPFKLDKKSWTDKLQEQGNMSLFYASPEVYFDLLYDKQYYQATGSSKNSYKKQIDQQDQIALDIQSDMWGLGCIFAEMFLSQTPLFSSQSFDRQAFSYFLVLGIPEKEEAYYINEDHHSQLCDLLIEKAKYEDLPILKHIMNKVPQKQSEILTSLLEFHPQNRVNSVNLLKFAFFQQHINNSPMYSPQKNQSADKMSLFDFSVSQRTNQKNHFPQQNNAQNIIRNEGPNQQLKPNQLNSTPQTEQYIQKPQNNVNTYYTQQPHNYSDKKYQTNSANKSNNWWNNDFSEQKNQFSSNQFPHENKINNGKNMKDSDKKNANNNILYVDSYDPYGQADQIESMPSHHQQSQQYNKRQTPLGSGKKADNFDNQSDSNRPYNVISRQSDHNASQTNYQFMNDQNSPPPKSISRESAQKQQRNYQNPQANSIQSQRSPDFSAKNDYQQPISSNSRSNLYTQNAYIQNQDQLPSANTNFSCNLTPIPHKVYQPSSNRLEVNQNQRDKINLFEEDDSNEGGPKHSIKTNNIFESQKPKFFLSQPQSQKGLTQLQPQFYQQNSQQRSFQQGYNRNLFNQSDDQNQSYISQNQTNKSAYLEYNERVNRIFGKNGYKQITSSTAKDRSTQQFDQNEQSEEEYSCVIEIKIKSLTNLQIDQLNQGIFNCKVDIPYIEQQCLTLEGDIQFDSRQAQNPKKMIPTQLDLSQAFNYKNIKSVLSEQPIQIKLFNSNQELYAHAFMDLSFNFLLKNPMVQDELLWQKPVQQWYHLINPEDPNLSYGKIKIETKVIVLKQSKKNHSFSQNKKKTSTSFTQGFSTSKNQNTQGNRSFNNGQKRIQQNQSFSSLNKIGRNNMKKNSSMNNLENIYQNEKDNTFQVLQQIQQNMTMLDEELKEKEKSLIYEQSGKRQKGRVSTTNHVEIGNNNGIKTVKGLPRLQDKLKFLLNQ